MCGLQKGELVPIFPVFAAGSLVHVLWDARVERRLWFATWTLVARIGV